MCIRNPKTIKSKRRYAYKVLELNNFDGGLLNHHYTPFALQKINIGKWNKPLNNPNSSNISYSKRHINKMSVLLRKPRNVGGDQKIFKVEIKYKELITGFSNVYGCKMALVDEVKPLKEIEGDF